MKKNMVSDYFKLEIKGPKDFKQKLETGKALFAFSEVYTRITCKICRFKIDICLGGDRQGTMKEHLWLHINEKKLEAK